jgi:hypothetical protein
MQADMANKNIYNTSGGADAFRRVKEVIPCCKIIKLKPCLHAKIIRVYKIICKLIGKCRSYTIIITY